MQWQKLAQLLPIVCKIFPHRMVGGLLRDGVLLSLMFVMVMPRCMAGTFPRRVRDANSSPDTVPVPVCGWFHSEGAAMLR